MAKVELRGRLRSQGAGRGCPHGVLPGSVSGRDRAMPDQADRDFTPSSPAGGSVRAREALRAWCGSAPKRGSGALSMTACSASYDEAGTQQVELGAPVHLPLDQLELGDLA